MWVVPRQPSQHAVVYSLVIAAHPRLCLTCAQTLEAASWTWAGGPNGTSLLGAFVENDLVRVLSADGVALIAVGLLPGPDEIVELVDRGSRGELAAMPIATQDNHGRKEIVFRVVRC